MSHHRTLQLYKVVYLRVKRNYTHAAQITGSATNVFSVTLMAQWARGKWNRGDKRERNRGKGGQSIFLCMILAQLRRTKLVTRNTRRQLTDTSVYLCGKRLWWRWCRRSISCTVFRSAPSRLSPLPASHTMDGFHTASRTARYGTVRGAARCRAVADPVWKNLYTDDYTTD